MVYYKFLFNFGIEMKMKFFKKMIGIYLKIIHK